MRSNLVFAHVAAAFAVCISLSATTNIYGDDPRYRIVDLGPLDGGLFSFAYGINDVGDVVGHTVVDFTNGNIAHSRPVVWKSGDDREGRTHTGLHSWRLRTCRVESSARSP